MPGSVKSLSWEIRINLRECGFGRGASEPKSPGSASWRGTEFFPPEQGGSALPCRRMKISMWGYYLTLEPGPEQAGICSGIRFLGDDGLGGKMFPYAVELG